MPDPPYAGPETDTSLQVLRDLAPGLPDPVMLLGGWGVYFTVRDAWRSAYAEEYFGSRDIDLGFHTPPGRPLPELRAGNMPATLAFLESRGFARQGMYQIVRYHDWETHAVLEPEQVAGMAGYQYYEIVIDLIASHQRDDLRQVAGFQAFSEELLGHAFDDPLHRREVDLEGQTIWIPAPHVLVATKLKSLPDRQKDHKSVKDLCDLYALTTASGVAPKTLRSRVHRILPDAPGSSLQRWSHPSPAKLRGIWKWRRTSCGPPSASCPEQQEVGPVGPDFTHSSHPLDLDRRPSRLAREATTVGRTQTRQYSGRRLHAARTRRGRNRCALPRRKPANLRAASATASSSWRR